MRCYYYNYTNLNYNVTYVKHILTYLYRLKFNKKWFYFHDPRVFELQTNSRYICSYNYVTVKISIIF